MGMFDWLTGKQEEMVSSEGDALATEIASTDIVNSKFANVYLSMIYTKIMHECADRASIPNGVDKSLYTATVHDSYSPFKRGLVSLLVAGMVDRSLEYYKIKQSPGVKLFEKIQRGEAFEENAKGEEEIKAGVLELDFQEFQESEVLELLFALLSAVLQAMSNGVTISQAVILKIHELSKMIANTQNLEPLTKQLRQLNDAISQGKPGVVDAKSALEFPKYDATPAEEASALVFKLISSLTGLPASYLFGEVVGGLGDTSESDTTRMNAAVRRYYHSIYSPAVKVVFNVPFEYKLLLSDAPDLVELMNWIEQTSLLTPEGKKRILLNNTPLTEKDIDVTAKQPEKTNSEGE